MTDFTSSASYKYGDIIRRRSGRLLSFGRRTVVTTRVTEGNHVFFDPIGSQDHLGCTPWSDAEFNMIEDALYELSVAVQQDENRWTSLTPSCRECRVRKGGNFEFNFGHYQIGIEVWVKPLYYVGMALNKVFYAWAEWLYG